MKNSNKTREQLLKELALLKAKIAKLEKTETWRKKAEKVLQEQEQNFRDLAENLLDGVAIVDKNAYHIYTNPKFSEITGYSKDELLQMTGWDFTRPEDVAKLKQRMKDRIAGKQHQKHYERIIVRKDGTEVLTEMSTTTSIWQGEKHLMAIIRDITERKQAEDTLRESEERFRQIYEHMAVGVAQISMDFRIEKANEAYCSMLGYSKGELIGKHLKDITHPETVEKNLRMQSKLATGEIDHYRMEKLFIHKSGNIVHGILDANLVNDAEGKPLYFLGSVLDITERKQAEEKLRESEEIFRAISESAIDSIFIKDVNYKYIHVNPAMEKLFGLHTSNLIGKTDIELFGEETGKHMLKLDKKVIKGEILIDEYEKTIGEKLYSFHTIKVPLKNSEGKTIGLCGIARDITEKKQAEEELAKHREHLEELVQERTKDLEEKNKKLQHYNELFLGREIRVKELKDKVKELEKKLSS